VAGKRSAREPLFGKRWVHVFEEDTAHGAVYRPQDGPIPLSRRPREHVELSSDGSARVFAPGPDDRLVERTGTWREANEALVVRTDDGGAELRIIEWSPERLVVEAHGGGSVP
jgi:hypothetical protein